jgi:hypothetical protein
VTSSRKDKHAGFWASLRLPGRGRLDIPLHPHRHFLDRGGKLCPIVQLCTEAGGTIGIRLVSDITEPVAVSREAYEPEIDALGIDFGLATLLATSEGDLFGRGLLADLVRIDRQITGIARHRMRSGDKPRNSARYRQLVTRVRGMLRTRINAALNRLVAVHKPAVLRIERLDPLAAPVAAHEPSRHKLRARRRKFCGDSLSRGALWRGSQEPRETSLDEAGRKYCCSGGRLACLQESAEISERNFPIQKP